MSDRASSTPSTGMVNLLDLPLAELKALVEATRTRTLAEEEIGKLNALIETMAFIQAHWQGQGPEQSEDKNATIKKLLTMIFGSVCCIQHTEPYVSPLYMLCMGVKFRTVPVAAG